MDERFSGGQASEDQGSLNSLIPMIITSDFEQVKVKHPTYTPKLILLLLLLPSLQ